MKRDKVIEYYNNYIDGILKKYINKFGEAKWLNIDDIKLIPNNYKTRIPWEQKFTDSYILDSSKDKTLLGKDIDKNGTYFPIFITKDNYVMMGYHRIQSLKLINYDKKILCIVLNDYHFNKDIIDRPKYKIIDPIKLDSFEMSIPTNIILPSDYCGSEYLLVRRNKKVFRKAKKDNNEFVKLKVQNFRDLMDAIKIEPHWIKDYFYEYKDIDFIKPRECMYKQEVFLEWIKS